MLEKGISKEMRLALQAILENLQDMDLSNSQTMDDIFQSIANDYQIKKNKLKLMVRIVVTGTKIGADLYETTSTVG